MNPAGLASLALLAIAFRPAAASSQAAPAPLPEAPQPQSPVQEKPSIERCELFRYGAELGVVAADAAASATGFSPRPVPQVPSCPSRVPLINWYSRFITGPQVKPMNPKEKAWLAVRNVGDPFNLATILGEAAISVGANSHSPYGPGMAGWGRYVGASFTQDMTVEFFGTFLIPSIAHQDPHYHRMPTATIKRRVLHAIAQVAWTQGDDGKGMLNYANLVGFAIDDEIANLYVPGQQTNAHSTAVRYVTGLASAPIDNLVAEFVPDIARRIHVQVVVIQRIINHVATTESSGSQ